MAEVDTSGWSGEGDFTQTLLDHLRVLDSIVYLRVEDAPSTRSEADYQFLSNEIFVTFAERQRSEPTVRFGFWRSSRPVSEKMMSLTELEASLSATEAIGAPDYSDDAMLQYLRTERIIPPYQTRGYKLVELVRVYEVGSERRR